MRREPERPKVEVSADLPPTRLRVYESRRKRTFTAKVAAIEGSAIVLEQTYFYPEGGGQEADRGRIGDYEVVDVQKVGPTVLHFVRGEPKLAVGKRVKCEIDWERRTNLTRNHSATHITLGAARKVLGEHVWQTGAHKAQDVARLDITHFEGLTDEQFREIGRLANDIVLSDRPVRVRNLPRDQAERKYGFRLYQGGSVPGGTVRVIEVPDWDIEACGGTHVARTSEVGMIKFLRSRRIQDGVVRLEYAAGRPALDRVARESRAVAAIGEELSVPLEEVVDAVTRMHAEWREQRKALGRVRREGAKDKVSPLVEEAERIGPARVVVYREAATMRELMALSRQLTDHADVVAILGGEGDTASLIISRGSDVPLDCAPILARAAESIGGKGGGKPDFAQGGGPDVAGLDDALRTAVDAVREALTGSS